RVGASLGGGGGAAYRLAWPGTLSLRPATLAAVMVDVCGGLHGAGAHRIVVVTWHEGNSPTLRLAADEAQREHGGQVVIAESHVITHTLFPGEMEFTHAGSMETAAVLAYDATLVHLEDATEPSHGGAAEVAHGLSRRPDVYAVLRDCRQIGATGWYGRPERADPVRAEQIAEAVADHVVARAREIWEALGTGAGGGAAEGSGPSGDRGFPPAGTVPP